MWCFGFYLKLAIWKQGLKYLRMSEGRIYEYFALFPWHSHHTATIPLSRQPGCRTKLLCAKQTLYCGIRGATSNIQHVCIQRPCKVPDMMNKFLCYCTPHWLLYKDNSSLYLLLLLFFHTVSNLTAGYPRICLPMFFQGKGLKQQTTGNYLTCCVPSRWSTALLLLCAADKMPSHYQWETWKS